MPKAKNLVIVESPAKAKTITKFLGKDYTVRASMGHVRDLPKSQMGIDIEHNFAPTYKTDREKMPIIKELKSLIDSKTNVWLATDQDREGEAISWHLLEALKLDEDKKVKRIVFHEITKEALQRAITEPRHLDHNLIDAQQARRVLDRLVGYELSPFLWQKVRYGLSAGRVQSVAVKLIVDREREIRAFKPDEYWHITGLFSKQKKPAEFSALLNTKKDEKIEIKNKETADKILKDLENCTYEVSNIDEKEVKRSPAAPFITSTLQQEAARKLGYPVKKTMVIAQQLYEGVEDLGGLITYMRTDSFNLAESALKQIRETIQKEYGEQYTLPSPRSFKSKKGAQEAHEAIRPVNISLKPDDIKDSLSKEQYHIYKLVWERAVACQMQDAILNRVGVDVKTVEKDYIFRATGQTIKFPGFMKVYIEGNDLEDDSENAEKILPPLEKGEKVDLKNIEPSQHFTKPPARYTEASLVKKLEAEGIGRPSTYAPTISTIIARGYVEKEAKQLKPTDTAEVVTDILAQHFQNIVDLKFTANMEEDLDKIAEGEKKWEPIIREFYGPFHSNIEEKKKTIQKKDVIQEETKEKCDKCGKPMVIKLGRFGKFLSCSDYPACKNAKPLKKEGEPEKSQFQKDLEKKLSDKKCDKCGKPMEIKQGRYGEFLGCSGYPECKNIQPLIKFTGVHCAKCKSGQLIERRTKKGGRIFYGCNKYPKCKFATWDTPVKDPCPKCKGLLVEKKGKEKKIKCTACEYEKEVAEEGQD